MSIYCSRSILTDGVGLSERPWRSSSRLAGCAWVGGNCWLWLGAAATGLLGPDGGEGKLVVGAAAKSANSPCLK